MVRLGAAMAGRDNVDQPFVRRVRFGPAERIDKRLGPVVKDPQILLLLPQPVTLLRPSDLLHVRFSFANLIRSTTDQGVVLQRRLTNRPAFLIMDFQPQHLVEEAFHQAAGAAVSSAPGVHADERPAVGAEIPSMPVRARLSTHTRLVFKVLTEQIPFTAAGLLDACSTLPLSVAPHAVAPPSRLIQFSEVVTDPRLKLADRMAVADGGSLGASVARISSVARSLATSAVLVDRIGSHDALTATSLLTVTDALDLGKAIDDLLEPGLVLKIRPTPRALTDTETAIELPWRLKLSPGTDGGFVHATDAVDHHGRVELWHSRFGVRKVTDGSVRIDEDDDRGRTVRAVWARDFDIDAHGFRPKPDLPGDFPDADGSDDDPVMRTSLNSRDRMMLVHETSNFTLRRSGRVWDPPPVAVDRMMLTALGGWLRSDLGVPELPDGALTISEWKHRATLGRDHEVKVVYAGLLMPFGHRASVVKVTERKFTPGQAGNPAYLYQRYFVVCREQTRHYGPAGVYDDQRDYGPIQGKKLLDLTMPLSSVSILTRVTPDLDAPTNLLGGGLVFFPSVDGSPFLFKIMGADREGHLVEYSGPLMFVERDHNQQTPSPSELHQVIKTYWNADDRFRRHQLGSQKVSYAAEVAPDGSALDTTLDTVALYWDAAEASQLNGPQDEPRFRPILRNAQVVVPAMSALAGANAPVQVVFPEHYAERGFEANAGHVFLRVPSTAPLDFSGQADRSGGFVTPNLKVTGLSGSTGPVGGDLKQVIDGSVKPADFFAGISAKLFGLVPLPALIAATGLKPDQLPSFVGQTLNRVSAFLDDLQRVVRLAGDAQARFAADADGQVQAAVSALDGVVADATGIITAITAFDPTVDLNGQIITLKGKLDGLAATVGAAAQLPAAVRNEAVGVARRLAEHVAEVGEIVGLIQQFADGITLPPVVSARLSWSTELAPWPAGAATVFQPIPGPGQTIATARSILDLSVEVQAPTRPGNQPTALVACSFTPFKLQLIGNDPFIALWIDKIEFLLAPGRKPDVNVVFHEGDEAVVFGGPLTFVNTLRDIIPFDGFSDPPYLDVSKDGIKAGFDLGVPTVAVGLFSLANISLGAHIRVPFIDDSLDFTFNFCTRENPFRLTVWLFGGGGFFGITVTPQKCRVLEAAFEFGAAVALNFGVASGSVEVMAGIYFRLEDDNSQLTGYFKLRGEVDVLGLISASIELYLELTYEPASKTATGRATLTVEVEVCFLSFSVQITCEKKFQGSDQDPPFAVMMGPDATSSPWNDYCAAFAAA